MPLDASYAHTNLIAEDWRALAAFYVEVFGCEPLPPERDIAGDWMDAGTGIPAAHIRGMHLRLPGHGPGGPTLEVFQYDVMPARAATEVHRPGFGHICFRVPDVAAAQALVLEHGGRAIGEVVTADIEGAGQITWCYVTDPEGNAVELQCWHD